MKKALAVTAILPLVLVACGGDSKPSRSEVLRQLGDEVIVPTYDKAAQSSANLVLDVKASCGDTAKAASTGTMLKTARADWKHTSAIALGPVMDQRTDAYVDYKFDPADVERLASGTTPTSLDPNTVGKSIAADQRGLGALEYLLASPRLSDPRYCQYATSIAEVAANAEKRAFDTWTKGEGGEPPYIETLVKDPGMSLDDLVNDNINVLRAASDQELRVAVGRNGAAGDPTVIMEGPLLDGAASLRARVEGVQAAMLGPDGSGGLSPLLTPETNAALKMSIDNALQAIDDIRGGLRSQLTTDPAKVTAAATAMDKVRTVLTTEVVSQLGVAVGFSDSDGDSAA